MTDDVLARVEAALTSAGEVTSDPSVWLLRALAERCKAAEDRVSAICSVLVDVMGPGWVVTPENVVDTIAGLLQADFVRYTKAESTKSERPVA